MGALSDQMKETKARISLHEYAKSNLQHKQGYKDKYICPICNSGKKTNGTPALSVQNENHWTCFSCGKGGDVFDLAAAVHGLARDDKRAQLQAVADWAGIRLDEQAERQPRHARREQPKEAAPDYTAARAAQERYVSECAQDVANPESASYLASRGISIEQAQAWGLGYDARRKRLVIPWEGCSHYHADRDVTGTAKAKYLYPKSEQVGARPLYNPAALDQPVFFIVEGALDALAVRAAGYSAVALGSNRDRQLSDQMNARRAQGAAVVFLDADQAGDDGAREIAAALDAMGVANVRLKVEGFKDPAEAYQKDREIFTAAVAAAAQEASELRERRREEEYNAAMRKLRAYNPADVAAMLWDTSNLTDPTPTGMSAIDDALGGGIPAGLIVLGAVSSVGKTTFALQIADQIAATGKPVLFVTIEQSAQELTAKSLARFMHVAKREGRAARVATAHEITSRTRREAWDDAQNVSFLTACNDYSASVAANMRILEGTAQPTVSDIKAAALAMSAHHGEAPAVFVDYLQLIAPENDRDGAKEAADHNVTALRQLARELRAPVFVISSLNRSSYGKGVTLDSFKESGAIEYGADALLGLQPAGMLERLDGIRDEKGAAREADKMTRDSKGKPVRECELVILKNRNVGLQSKPFPLTFNAPACLFTCLEGEQQEISYDADKEKF